MTLSVFILAAVTLSRLVELLISRRNTERLLAAGAREHAPEHYPLIVLLHGAWLAGLWLLAWDADAHPWWLAVFILLQGLRIWVLLSLGRRWTTRIIVLPGMPLVRIGPYRFVSHPNYLVVIGEIAVLPLVFTMPVYAIVFSLLNAVLLTVRIRAENRAMASGGRRSLPIGLM
ncbi:MAG: hypothetical protein MEQ84_13045 [Mesorhizobium sp.]|nr:hypothetical protein [Mesorhizobium sp.]